MNDGMFPPTDPTGSGSWRGGFAVDPLLGGHDTANDRTSDPNGRTSARPPESGDPTRRARPNVVGSTGRPVWTGRGRQTQVSPRERALLNSVRLRWAATWLAIVVTSTVSHVCFAGTTAYAGGYLQFCLAMAVLALGGFATMAYANDRHTVVKDVRSPLLTILGGGTSTAIVSAVFRGVQGPTGGDTTNMFAGLFLSGLPIIFLTTVAIPALLYARTIWAHRALHRSAMDSEELVSIYTRQDGLQR
jgi:hypothetical protein